MESPEGALLLDEIPVGVFLKRARTNASLRLRAVAERAQCNPGTLSRIENGQWTPSTDLVARIANAIGEMQAESRGAA